MTSPPKFTPHPSSAPGDFYVEKGMCLACGVPHVVAPDLIGWTDEKLRHCYWKKQPETSAQLESAIAVLESQELDCHRYAGTEPSILDRLSPACCDHPAQIKNVIQQAEPAIPHFALLDDRPSLFTKLWGALWRMGDER